MTNPEGDKRILAHARRLAAERNAKLDTPSGGNAQAVSAAGADQDALADARAIENELFDLIYQAIYGEPSGSGAAIDAARAVASWLTEHDAAKDAEIERLTNENARLRKSGTVGRLLLEAETELSRIKYNPDLLVGRDRVWITSYFRLTEQAVRAAAVPGDTGQGGEGE